MSQNKRKNSKAGRTGIPPVIYGLVGILALVVVYRLAAPGLEPAGHHPDPRGGVTADNIVPADQVNGPTQVAAIYAAAREIPEVLDGLYCHCDCSLHSGHRSLLTCFESDHAAGCDICLEEGRIAAQMTAEGHSLKEIRERIDALYG